ncbi:MULTISPECIES: hypothetical protein [Nocardia]|uniref:Uncharacterized protein n=1 Tax=Nocardia sputorum TaxID=2984338 RepID=A0ABN6U6R9_9NOCA|nr:hypothetical protein [Nocardia sputorum]BDU00979.1 hypothetical protein IFM12276_40070 [Nocardia sputorum]
MTDHHLPPAPHADASEPEFLHQVLARIDRWFDDANPDDLHAARDLLRQRLASTIAAVAAADDSDRGDPVVALIATELHRLRRTRVTATVITRGGHVHDHVRVHAVHRHHTVLSRAGEQAGVLLPLTFIESVTPLSGGTADAVSAVFSHRKEC